MATPREELERLRKLKRLRELEAKAAGSPTQERRAPQLSPPTNSFRDRLRQASATGNDVDPETGLILRPLTQQTTANLTIGPSKEAVLEALSTPFRGTRGIGVGVLKGFREGSISEGLLRGAEAVKPGFRPEGIVESVVSSVAESAPVLPALAAGGGAGALAAGTQNLILQGAEEESVSPGRVALASALGGIGGGGIRGGVRAGRLLAAPSKEAAELGVQRALPVNRAEIVQIAQAAVRRPNGSAFQSIESVFNKLVESGNDAVKVYGDNITAMIRDRAIAKEVLAQGAKGTLESMAKKISSVTSQGLRKVSPAAREALEGAQNQMTRDRIIQALGGAARKGAALAAKGAIGTGVVGSIGKALGLF